MTDSSSEKSPIEPSDYQGLQLDTRTRDTNDKYVDPEKEFFAGAQASDLASTQPARSSATSSVGPSTAGNAKEKRICGLRRRVFWLFLAAILIIIILAAVLGGVLGAQRNRTSTPTAISSPPPTSSGAAPPNNATEDSPPESQSNVILGSPMAMLAYARQDPNANNATNGDSQTEQQSLRLFFQSAHGNIKWSGYDGVLAPWRDANPIFTDAINNTGLSVFTYLNGTDQSFAIYYIGANGLVQEKRASLGQTTFLPTTLNSLNLKPAAALSIPTEDSDAGFNNTWDGYRMASVYSTNFYDGPGARMFYHFLADNGSTWVQEMIWNQGSDLWSEGAVIVGPWPSSRLAAIIDETGSTLRLFYSAGNRTLQESYLNIQDANATYQTGVSIPGLLAADDADLAVVGVNGDVLIYHYSTEGTPSIRELNITGVPGSRSSPETFDLSSESIVAQPAVIADGQLSLYQPIGAVVANASGVEPRIYVSWAEQNAGANTSYGAMTVVSRGISQERWPNSTYGDGDLQVDLPLGDYNVDPSD